MRLTCPNCGAQYEVPSEVIPTEGRDVQCSNCGDTWFQAHPDHSDEAAETNDAPPPPAEEHPEAPAYAEAEPEDDLEPDTPEPDPEPDYDTDPEPYVEPPAAGVKLDDAVSGILRAEAEREAQLRAQEGGGLESQPELGLDSPADDEPERRAREARDRMARMRGEEPVADAAATETGTRRGLLPDIEEINSTLRGSSDPSSSPATEVGPATAAPRKSGGFRRGFTVMILLGVILTALYMNAKPIAQAVPQADPMISAYVTLIDQARVWIDAQASNYRP